jgi:hypothetical protein
MDGLDSLLSPNNRGKQVQSRRLPRTPVVGSMKTHLELTADCKQITGNSKAIRFSENRNEKAAFKQTNSLASKLWGRPLRPRQL